MLMMIKNVVLLGASGNLGSATLEPLHTAGFTVTILARPESTASFPSWATVVRASYTDNNALTEAFRGQDAVVACSAPTAARLLNNILDTAIAAGVKLFIPSDFVTDIFHPRIPELGIYDDKLAHHRYLVEKSKQGKISWTTILCGLWIDWVLEKDDAPIGFNKARREATIYGTGDARWSCSTVENIVRAIVGVLQHPSDFENQVVYIETFVTSQNDILAALEEVTGEKWKTDRLEIDEMVKRGKELIERNDPRGWVELGISAFMRDDGRYGPDFHDKVTKPLWVPETPSLKEVAGRKFVGKLQAISFTESGKIRTG